MGIDRGGQMWFDNMYSSLIFEAIFLFFSIYMFLIYLKNPTKYNLAVLILIAIVFVMSTMDLFFPELNTIKMLSDSLNFNMWIRILILVVFSIAILLFLSYPYWKHHVNKLKIRNK